LPPKPIEPFRIHPGRRSGAEPSRAKNRRKVALGMESKKLKKALILLVFLEETRKNPF
jgi:hypothetical protein